VQGTYDGAAKAWAWDNADFRFTKPASIARNRFVFGASINNDPSVQDVWNSTPAWRFPFDTSSLAPAPPRAR